MSLEVQQSNLLISLSLEKDKHQLDWKCHQSLKVPNQFWFDVSFSKNFITLKIGAKRSHSELKAKILNLRLSSGSAQDTIQNFLSATAITENFFCISSLLVSGDWRQVINLSSLPAPASSLSSIVFFLIILPLITPSRCKHKLCRVVRNLHNTAEVDVCVPNKLRPTEIVSMTNARHRHINTPYKY